MMAALTVVLFIAIAIVIRDGFGSRCLCKSNSAIELQVNKEK
jgi:hypothetical protein